MSVLIHFGMHKTGSSSIQRSLNEGLVDKRFYYLNLNLNKAGNSSGALMTAFLEQPETYHANRKRNISKSELIQKKHDILERLESELSSANGRTAILSAEDVYVMMLDDLSRLSDFIARYSANTALVGYIRTPKGFMESAFQQRIKGGSKKSWKIEGLCPKYRQKFENLDQVFGYENVRFWKFDPTYFAGGDVVMDFCSRLGIDFSPEKSMRVNEGLALSAVKLLYAYRKYGPGYGLGPTAMKENRRLIKAISELKGNKLRLHSSIVQPLLKVRRDQITWMEQRMGESLQEDLTKEDEIAIRSEADLLRFEPKATQWLASQLGPEYENRWNEKMTPQEVANWMHLLRLKLTADIPVRRRRKNGSSYRAQVIEQTL